METSSKATKAGRQFAALLTASVTLAIATFVSASTSTQVKQLDPLVVPRTAHAATALTDGRILITGGRDSAGNIVAVSEIFDPATDTSTASATLTTPRVDHTATLLPDGKVLVAGGADASGSLSSVEIFDPANAAAGFRMLAASMGAARARHTATVLNDGKVLIAGGDDAGTAETSTAEIFDPATETFSSVLMAMAAPRIGHTATLFSDDSVLLAGGNTDSMEHRSLAAAYCCAVVRPPRNFRVTTKSWLPAARTRKTCFRAQLSLTPRASGLTRMTICLATTSF